MHAVFTTDHRELTDQTNSVFPFPSCHKTNKANRRQAVPQRNPTQATAPPNQASNSNITTIPTKFY